MKCLVLFLLLFASPLLAQLNYAVSGGSQAFVPLNPATANVVQNLTGAPPNNATIKPQGFFIPFEVSGQLHEFRARSMGVLQFAYDPNIATTFWNPSPMCARMLAPCLHDWAYTASSTVLWEFTGSVLTVEWLNVEDASAPAGPTPLTVSFQVVIDMATSSIEYRYGAATGGPYAFAGTDFCVSITGSNTTAGRCFMPGTLAGFVDANGRMTQWPDDSYIRFTPTGTGRSAPVATISMGGNAINDNVQIFYPSDTTVASLNIQITVTDADGDAATVAATITSPALITAEFESASAAVPYTLNPTTGILALSTSHLIQLIITDGQDGLRVIRFGMWTPAAGGGGGVSLDPWDLPLVEFTFQLGSAVGHGVANQIVGCSAGSGSSLPMFLLQALIAACALRRRLTPPKRRGVLNGPDKSAFRGRKEPCDFQPQK